LYEVPVDDATAETIAIRTSGRGFGRVAAG